MELFRARATQGETAFLKTPEPTSYQGMLNLRNFRHLLVALVFLASQWLLVVHATEHQLKSGPDIACELCSVADAGSAAPAAPHIPDAAPVESFALVLSNLATPASAQLRLPPSCGPPVHLA